MDKKITLDIDFGEDEVKEITIPQTKEKNKNKEYIKNLIQIGLDICKEYHSLTNNIIDGSDLFMNCGINEEILLTLNYLSEVFGNIVPNILIANYDDLASENLLLTEEESIEFFKNKRKTLLKRIQELNNEEE